MSRRRRAEKREVLPDPKFGDLVVTKFRGLAGPKGIPDEVATMWETALRTVIGSDAYRQVYSSEALVPVMLGRAEARRFTMQAAEEITAGLKEMGVIR